MSSRVETGPVQIGEDWPGVFIRGDQAMMIAMQCRKLQEIVAPRLGAFLIHHAELLESCEVKKCNPLKLRVSDEAT